MQKILKVLLFLSALTLLIASCAPANSASTDNGLPSYQTATPASTPVSEKRTFNVGDVLTFTDGTRYARLTFLENNEWKCEANTSTGKCTFSYTEVNSHVIFSWTESLTDSVVFAHETGEQQGQIELSTNWKITAEPVVFP